MVRQTRRISFKGCGVGDFAVPTCYFVIAALAAKAAGKEARIVKVPVGVLRGAGLLFRPFYPRVGHLMTFIADILVEDFAAPCYGTRHIEDYFNERAAKLQKRGT